MALLPWHERQFGELRNLADAGRLGHAWLLAGLQGIGKLEFCRYLASYLLCRQPEQGRPCGQCNDCHLFSVGTHPDWRLLQPEKRLITIDQIRESIDFAGNTSQRGKFKILCIDPAEAMNLNAANALLKLLEEPPPQTLLFLLSHQPGLLLATLRSRCQLLRLPLPGREQALDWLERKGCGAEAGSLLSKARGAPLHALAMSETGLLAEHETILDCLQSLLSGEGNPIREARKCEKIGIGTVIDLLMQGIAELIATLQSGQTLRDPELEPLLRLLGGATDETAGKRRLYALHRLYQTLGHTRKEALSSNNPNPQLILEQIFGDWSKLRALSAR